MSALASRAFGNARVRALRGRLFGPEQLDRLRVAPTQAARAGALRALGIEASSAGEAQKILAARLADDLAKLWQGYPAARPLLRCFVDLAEVENLKLALRAVHRSLPAARWTPFWRPLGKLARLDLETLRDATTRRQLEAAIARLPVAAALRGSTNDLAAAELGLDRWASVRLLDEAAALPAGESAARDLLLMLVRERDLDALWRAVSAQRLSPESALAAAALLPAEAGREPLLALLRWAPGDGPLSERLPRELARRHRLVADWPALLLALRLERRAACLRAFLGPPFRLAAVVALFLLREAELHAVPALLEAGEERPAALVRVLAASSLEAR